MSILMSCFILIAVIYCKGADLFVVVSSPEPIMSYNDHSSSIVRRRPSVCRPSTSLKDLVHETLVLKFFKLHVETSDKVGLIFVKMLTVRLLRYLPCL